ncbi:GNAT family acetyltransferase [Pseudomonas sp. M30-35]|uniref:GNAT family acetyltransferase n=1 Tax=Pseudomonas sp. M30-35 TaxID=1981174 RepID=UPI000B3C5871|nr:GNAT family acetyltransferase [Pseudomonas sp. M30-35]ARU86903.1 GNAT family acetyltransferase [Pseudomonas sp. M30-35]
MNLISQYSNRLHRQAVIALWQATFGDMAGHNEPGLAIDKKLQMADGLFFVALAGDAVVGTVLAGYDGHRGWLYSVAVDPQHQRQGIGVQLIEHAEHALAERGCMKINLQIISANAQVSAFYESLGYSIEPRISMGKRVAANIPASG